MIKFWTISSGAIKGNQYIKIMTKKIKPSVWLKKMHMTIMIKFKTISIDCAIKEKTHHDTYYDPQKF